MHGRQDEQPRRLSRRRFCASLASAAAGLYLAPRTLRADDSPVASRRPNIVFLLSDDQGYGDIGALGDKGHVVTPNLDALAKQGMLLKQYYAPSSVCSPSRAGTLTGRIPTRTGVYNHGVHMEPSEVTIAHLLGKAGYATGHFGKWHLSTRRDFAQRGSGHPGEFGFDYWLATYNNAKPSHRDPANFYRNGKPVGKMDGYSCQLLVDEALDWLRTVDDEKPFFMNLWFHEPHVPFAAPDDFVQRVRRRGGGNVVYRASIEHMDNAIGRLLASLDKRGLSENTIVIFASDNGSKWGEPCNGHLRGDKGELYEGGIRVPAIVRWPGKVKPGSVSDDVCCGLDWLPTLCAACGLEPPADREVDGEDIRPLLKSGRWTRTKPVFWYRANAEPQCALRHGRWILLGYLDKPTPGRGFSGRHMQYIRRTRPSRFELYDLQADPRQESDVLSANHDRAQRMITHLKKLHSEAVLTGPDRQAAYR